MGMPSPVSQIFLLFIFGQIFVLYVFSSYFGYDYDINLTSFGTGTCTTSA